MERCFSTALIVASIASLGLAATVEAQSVQPTFFEVTGYFDAGRLRESSGVAVSRTQPGVLWTHNDSGDRARIYATNLHGDDLGRFRVRGADADDWEDIAIGPCPQDSGQSCLFIADTGDNNAERSEVSIYIVPEPDVSEVGRDSEGRTERARELRITYPDGPRDVESLALTHAGDLLLITKGRREPIVLYSISSRLVAEDSVEASVVDTLPIDPTGSITDLVTAADISPNGQTLVVRTYTALFFFSAGGGGSWQPVGSPCWIGLRQPQGEGIGFIDDTTVVLTSESAFGRAGGVARATCAF